MNYLQCFCGVALLFFGNESYSQTLQKGVQNYALGEHLLYNPELIRENKIKSIEKIIFAPLGDSLDSGVLVEQSTFRSDGWPERMETKKTYRSKETSIEFQYDSLGHLLKKTVLKPSESYPSSRQKTREEEIVLWMYQGDAITKKLYYLTPRGMDSNNETLSLFSCDSFHYNAALQTVDIRSNFREDCPNPGKEYFSRSFDYPQKITLDFYSNNRVKTRNISSAMYTASQKMDSCGLRETELTTLFSNIIAYPNCFSKDWYWLEHKRIDSVRYKGDSVTIHLKSDHFFETNLAVFDHLDNSNHLRIFPDEKRFEVRTISENNHIFQAGNNHQHLKETKQYDFDMKLLRVERIISSYWDGDRPWVNEIVIHANTESEEERSTIPIATRTDKELYEYYENGMLKSVTSMNGNDAITQKTVYEMTYFQ